MSSAALTPSYFYAPIGTVLSDHDDVKLCIEIGDDHLAYTVSDASGKNISLFKYFNGKAATRHHDLGVLLSTESILQRFFTDVILLNNTSRFVLLPEQLHKEHLAQTVLETVHGNLDLTSVHADNIHQWEITVVYGLDKALEDLVMDKFPQTRIVHFVSPALRYAFRNMDLTCKQSLKLFFYHDSFLVMVFIGDQLQILQHFNFVTTEDVLYHILNVVEKYRLDVTEVMVNVSGCLDVNTPIWTELKKHFLEISVEKSVVVNDGQSAFPSHYFTPFFMVPSCV
jgi:hypothetical protein